MDSSDLPGTPSLEQQIALLTEEVARLRTDLNLITNIEVRLQILGEFIRNYTIQDSQTAIDVTVFNPVFSQYCTHTKGTFISAPEIQPLLARALGKDTTVTIEGGLYYTGMKWIKDQIYGVRSLA